MKCRLQESTSRQQHSRWRTGWLGVAARRGGRQLKMGGDDRGGCGQQHSAGDAPVIASDLQQRPASVRVTEVGVASNTA